MFIFKKSEPISIFEHTVSLVEAILAFAAFVLAAWSFACSPTDFGLSNSLFTHYIAGLTSYVRIQTPHGITLGVLAVARIIAAIFSIILIYTVDSTFAGSAWPVIAVIGMAIQLLIAVWTLVNVVYHFASVRMVQWQFEQRQQQIFWQHVAWHTWWHILAWFTISAITMGSCGSRPLLIFVTAPSIILTHISLCYDLHYRRVNHWSFFSRFTTTTSDDGQKLTEYSGDIACLHHPIAYTTFGLVCGLVSLMQIIIVFIFPIAKPSKICLSYSPAECTFVTPKTLLAVGISTVTCVFEFARCISSWIEKYKITKGKRRD